MNYDILNIVVSILTLGALTWTLFVLRRYAADTKDIAKAAVEQMPRPCVVLKQYPDRSVPAVMNYESSSLFGDKEHLSPLTFRNAGTAMAVNCRYHVFDFDKEQRKEQYSCRLPEIEPLQEIDSSSILNSLPDNAVVSIEYESITGVHYQTELTIADVRWVKEIRLSEP